MKTTWQVETILRITATSEVELILFSQYFEICFEESSAYKLESRENSTII